jgi:sulfite reductase (NADPH) flavoprotein alpha-component
MLRHVHSWLGLLFGLFLSVCSLSGATLSLEPALQHARAIVPARGSFTVAEVANTLAHRYTTIEQIERLPSGAVLVYFTELGQSAAFVVDPSNGEKIEIYQVSAFFSWVKRLHRSWLVGNWGRAFAGIVALLMLLSIVTGSWLLLRRVGGWRHLLGHLRAGGHGADGSRLHVEVARVAVVALVFSAITGAWLSAIRFEVIAEAPELVAKFPEQMNAGEPLPLAKLTALQQVDLVDLHQLIFPTAQDPEAIYALRTQQGSGYIDPVTGAWLSYADYGNTAKLQTTIAELHTGEAYWWFGLVLGFASLAVPLLAVTGLQIGWQRRSAMPKIRGNAAKHLADTIVLVGSETNTTWGFAYSLFKALQQAGCVVHLSSMTELASEYPKASRLLILTATYGDGDAPASATQFLAKLAIMPASAILPWAVLGFGDQQFNRYCAFAKQVEQGLQAKHWPQLLATQYVDRQSVAAFEAWGSALATAIALPLKLSYVALARATVSLILVARAEFGVAVKAPTVILGFKAAQGQKLPRFRAGDLIGIVPKGSDLPRLYSVASSSKTGLLEICVRAQSPGLCSNQLFALNLGDTIKGFIQTNPRFKPNHSTSPLLLIGAGTGIAPLIGFIRANKACRPIYLYWGGRLASADFLYHEALILCLADKRLSKLRVAFSRSAEPEYVQDKLRQDAELIRQLLRADTQILVCGARNMAAAVATTLDEIIEAFDSDSDLDSDLDVSRLRKSGRYLEDSY